MSVAEAPRILFCAFAEVPGTTSAGTRTAQWLSVFGTKEMDALALKGTQAAHIQRLGGARMMRVPNTSGKPLLERLSTYTRAVQRQLAGEPYDLVWCADLFSAGIVAPLVKGTAPMILEVSVVPSQSRALLAAAASGEGSIKGDEGEIKKTWRDAERAAIRAAARVLVPSRHSAKLIAERIDPRVLLVVQRSVDRTVFSPPSVEIAIDDERLVVIFGGREGGARTRVGVSLAQALAITLPSSVRIGLLGAPSAADPDVRAALTKVGLGDRVELIDADSNLAVTAALSLAHVVVVPSCAEEDAEPFALPHRALEGMACGRAVVVTGPEGCFRDAATPGEHIVVVPAKEPRRVADAVEALLEDPLTRASLGRAAARHVERTADLLTRSQEVLALVDEATKVSLRIHEPRIDDPDSSSKPFPPGPAIPSTAVAAPPAIPSSGTNSSGSQSGPVFAAPRARETPRARGLVDASSPDGDPRPIADLPGVLSVVQAVPTVRMEMPNLGSAPPSVPSVPSVPSSVPSSVPPSVPEGGAMWDGDTFLDGNLEGAPLALQTNPDAARVRAAMLVSSDAQSKAGSGSSGEAALTSQASQPSQPPMASSSPSNPAIPTSLIVQAALESRAPSADPWASDTIADGTPIDTGRELRETSASSTSSPSSGGSNAAPSKGAKRAGSFLVEASGKVERPDRAASAASASANANAASAASAASAYKAAKAAKAKASTAKASADDGANAANVASARGTLADDGKSTTKIPRLVDVDELPKEEPADMTMEDQPLQTSSESSKDD